MITTIYRIVKYGFQNFWRNHLVSIATILVLFLSVTVFLGLLLFGAVGHQAILTVQDKIDISVYFKPDAPEDDILALKNALEYLDEVKAVEYISKDQALEIFKKRHEGNETISRALTELEENPLSASLNIKAKNPDEYGAIAAYLGQTPLQPIIDKVTYSQNQVVIERLAKIINIGKQGGTILTLILAFIAIVVAFNTILLAIYSNREEINIMRLVGASHAFIRGPYIFVGILYGFFATVLTILISIPVIYAVSPYVSVFITGMNLWGYFWANFFKIFGSCLLFGTSIGVISSLIVIRRYLR